MTRLATHRAYCGMSFAARIVTTNAAATTSSHHGASRNAYPVLSKSIVAFAAASPPATSTGRNGRMPQAAPSPMAVRMSNANVTSVPPPMMPDGPPAGGRAHRDLERYAGLFASRTRVMKSSAMRYLMAITERPEVISLAGGLLDTSTFPAERLAAIMSRVAADNSAKALQYAPTEGMACVARCIAEVMAEE